jgi:hypothetical protein
MKKIVRMTKVKRLISIPKIVSDIRSDMSDEEIMEAHGLNLDQLTKVYSRLFHGGHLSAGDLARRVEMRNGEDAGHIPLADMVSSPHEYGCANCGFESQAHFTTCPRCGLTNLRRLSRLLQYAKTVNELNIAPPNPISAKIAAKHQVAAGHSV